MKKLFLLLAVATVALTSCSEPHTDYRAINLYRDSGKDTIVILDKYVVDGCTKIVYDTIKHVDCSGVITKHINADTTTEPAVNYVFYIGIGQLNRGRGTEKISVSDNVFTEAQKGDTTNIDALLFPNSQGKLLF